MWSKTQRECAREFFQLVYAWQFDPRRTDVENAVPETWRRAFERLYARLAIDADRTSRELWREQLAPREAVLTDLLDGVAHRLAELERLRDRASGFAARRVLRTAIGDREVLHDGFAATEVVYGLVDPSAPDIVRYVGRSNNPIGRYREHVANPGVPLRHWLKSLEDRAPVMVLLERCSPANVDAREQYWIAHFRESGQADLNRHFVGCKRETAERAP